MRNIYVATHTEATHHVQGLRGGWYDTSHTEHGRDQAAKVATALRREMGNGGIPVYSSDLKRCAETASIIAEALNSTVALDARLREMCYGEGEGKDKEWGGRNITPQPSDGNRLDHQVFNGSETRREVGTRVQSVLGEIVSTPDENVIVVTHGFALTFVIMAWLRVPVDNMGYCGFGAAPGGVTLLREDDLFENRSVVYMNRLDHLAG